MSVPSGTLAPQYAESVLQAAIAEAERCYPVEGCGLIFFGTAGTDGASGHRVLPMENVIDRYHARDPIQFPRTARTGYFMEPLAQLRALEAAAAAGERLGAVFHSHADVGAYFSAEDKAMAAPEGQPLLPGVSYLVIAVDGGRATTAKLFHWDGQGFSESEISAELLARTFPKQ